MEYSTIGWENEYRTNDEIKSKQHNWNATHGNDIFISTVENHFLLNSEEKTTDGYQEVTMILGMPGRHGYNNVNLVKNIGEVLRGKYPKKGKTAFESGRISYFSGDDGRPGTQLIIEEKSTKSVDIQIVGRTGLTNSYEIPREISKVSLTLSDSPLEDAIAITQADIAQILHLVQGMQKDMHIEGCADYRYKLLANSIIGLRDMYADDTFLEEQRENLSKIHNPKALSDDFSAEDMRNIYISHYTESVGDEYNTYLAIITSQYILLPDAIKKDFDFFIQAAQDMQAKTQKVKDMRMLSKREDSQDEMIQLLDSIDTNLIQRNSRFHSILQDMCKHPEVQRWIKVFDN